MNENEKDTQTQTPADNQQEQPKQTTPNPADQQQQKPVADQKTDNTDVMAELAALKKMLEDERAEKVQIKFDAYKDKAAQKYSVDADVFDLLGITADTAEADADAKLTKFAEKVKSNIEAVDKDDKVFFKSPTNKASVDDQVAQLIKEGKVNEALALKLKK